MGITLDNNRISDTAWGDVDKSALGRRLAKAFADGSIGKPEIKAVYAYVPDDAFADNADRKPNFAYTKASYPYRELIGDAIVINRNGVHAAAQRLSADNTPPPGAMAAIRAAYKKLQEDVPASLKESMTKQKIGRGKPLSEANTKGSLGYTLDQVTSDFREQFPPTLSPEAGGMIRDGFIVGPYIVDGEVFADYVVAKDCDCEEDEYFKVPFTVNGGEYTFALREQWQSIELTYQPAAEQTQQAAQEAMAEAMSLNQAIDGMAEPAMRATLKKMMSNADAKTMLGDNKPADMSADEVRAMLKKMARSDKTKADMHTAMGGMTEANATLNGNGKGKRLIEKHVGVIALAESSGGGPHKIRGEHVITAGIVNENGRRYPVNVVAAAVKELKLHLHESAGQGRLLQLLGEAEHPSDKGNRSSQLLETVVKWDDATFDGEHVSLSGRILETARGRDLIAIMEGGVTPGLSLRGRGDSTIINENSQRVEEVTELHITGFDLVSEAGFQDAMAVLESKQENDEMDPKKLAELIAANPDLFKGVFEGKLEALGADQLKKLEESVRAKLGIDDKADLGKALTEAVEAKKKLDEQTHAAEIDAAITEATKALPYGKQINEAFVAAVRNAKPADAAAVKTIVESKRKEYDAISAKARLDRMGFQIVGPVLEQETGTPEYARGAYEFTEALVRRGIGKHIDVRKPENRNELYVAAILKRFDEKFSHTVDGGGLIAESKRLQETGEQTSDLSLPYSASRAVIAAAVAQLVASSVFDFGTIDSSPTRIYYESFAEDSTVTKTVAMGEAITMTLLDTFYPFANKGRIIPGQLTVKPVGEGSTYVEGTDYLVDYGGGQIKALTGGAVTAGDVLHVGYKYFAIRKGELAGIERGKGQLGFVLADAQADRLADMVSREAILFSRSQVGWDAVTATMSMLVDQVRRKIDQGVFYLALASVLSVANNSGGTWSQAGNSLDDLALYIGDAKVKIDNRYWTPTGVVMSKTNSNALSNWLGFTAAGKFPSADLKENGYVGRIKGLPVFESTEMSDSYDLVVNRQLVLHRVFEPMTILGPFPSYEASTGLLIAADQYYAEEFNVDVSPVPNKGSYVKITA